jgi:ATP-dependent Clp protease ATP-binding subunit ClpB
MIEDLNKRLKEKDITISVTDNAKDYIVQRAYDPVYGARPLKRYLQKNVETLSARLILSDEAGAGDTIIIDVEERGLYARVKQ